MVTEHTLDPSKHHAWSDYVYAGGRIIGRADSYDQRIHMHGTYAQTGVEHRESDVLWKSIGDAWE